MEHSLVNELKQINQRSQVALCNDIWDIVTKYTKSQKIIIASDRNIVSGSFYFCDYTYEIKWQYCAPFDRLLGDSYIANIRNNDDHFMFYMTDLYPHTNILQVEIIGGFVGGDFSKSRFCQQYTISYWGQSPMKIQPNCTNIGNNKFILDYNSVIDIYHISDSNDLNLQKTDGDFVFKIQSQIINPTTPAVTRTTGVFLEHKNVYVSMAADRKIADQFRKSTHFTKYDFSSGCVGKEYIGESVDSYFEFNSCCAINETIYLTRTNWPLTCGELFQCDYREIRPIIMNFQHNSGLFKINAAISDYEILMSDDEVLNIFDIRSARMRQFGVIPMVPPIATKNIGKTMIIY